jgi:tetratricopeptide (TPR) repeat protein
LHLHVAETQVGVGDLDQALREARAALAALPDAEDMGRSTIYEAIGCIHLLRSELADAERWIDEGLALARASSAARSECTLLGKRGLVFLARGEPERAFEQFDAAVEKNEARGASTMLGASLSDRAMAAFALGRETDAAEDLARARELLHDPPAESVDGRVLIVCEIVGRAFGRVRTGTPAQEALTEARTSAAAIFDRLQEWGIVLRLAEWLVSRIAA